MAHIKAGYHSNFWLLAHVCRATHTLKQTLSVNSWKNFCCCRIFSWNLYHPEILIKLKMKQLCFIIIYGWAVDHILIAISILASSSRCKSGGIDSRNWRKISSLNAGNSSVEMATWKFYIWINRDPALNFAFCITLRHSIHIDYRILQNIW